MTPRPLVLALLGIVAGVAAAGGLLVLLWALALAWWLWRG